MSRLKLANWSPWAAPRKFSGGKMSNWHMAWSVSNSVLTAATFHFSTQRRYSWKKMRNNVIIPLHFRSVRKLTSVALTKLVKWLQVKDTEMELGNGFLFSKFTIFLKRLILRLSRGSQDSSTQERTPLRRNFNHLHFFLPMTSHSSWSVVLWLVKRSR